MKEWEQLTERIGFWIQLDEAYVTFHQSYVESVWGSLEELFNRGLLYQGHKIVWWWAQGGTALSAGEVGQGYREVADPSVYVVFPLLDDAGSKTDENLLVWTTTPWTLPSNQFAAVHPDLEYAVVLDVETNQRMVIAARIGRNDRREGEARTDGRADGQGKHAGRTAVFAAVRLFLQRIWQPEGPASDNRSAGRGVSLSRRESSLANP